MNKTQIDLMTPMEILETALEKERDAKNYYDQVLQHSRHSELLRGLLEDLANEEAKHARLIEQKLAALRMGRA